jgi:hypothetical protein
METEAELNKRLIALENGLLTLIDSLAMRGVISVNEGEDILRQLANGSSRTAARATQSLQILSQLKRLRQGNGASAPGAPTSGPIVQE